VRGRQWSHYAAPAAFLLAVTVAVLLVRNALETEGRATTSAAIPTAPRRTAPAPTTTRRVPPKRRPPATQRFYTVVAGDTFAVIAAKTGVSAAKIQQLNPTVQSTALFIGQKLRIR
jgi:LysM repeat protein